MECVPVSLFTTEAFSAIMPVGFARGRSCLMNLENMKRKYAYTLARVGLNVQQGQTVLVEAAIEGW